MRQRYALHVNGTAYTIEADEDMPLLYALRDDLGLNNPRFGCGLAHGRWPRNTSAPGVSRRLYANKRRRFMSVAHRSMRAMATSRCGARL